MSWTSTNDVIDSWIGDDAPTNTNQVQIWIDRAERLLRRRIPTLETRIEESEGSTELLGTARDVVSAMVQRVFRNPEGIRQTSQTTGPFSEQRTYGGDQPGALWVTEQEVADLTGSTAGQTAFQIDPLAGYVAPSWGLGWE